MSDFNFSLTCVSNDELKIDDFKMKWLSEAMANIIMEAALHAAYKITQHYDGQ
jgi:hypothetical protein